jgi:hypothetical protein
MQQMTDTARLPVLLEQNATVNNRVTLARALRTSTTPTRLPPSELFELLAALPVSFQTVSRPLELSLQSSLQLSLKVLVCYWSRGYIEL